MKKYFEHNGNVSPKRYTMYYGQKTTTWSIMVSCGYLAELVFPPPNWTGTTVFFGTNRGNKNISVQNFFVSSSMSNQSILTVC